MVGHFINVRSAPAKGNNFKELLYEENIENFMFIPVLHNVNVTFAPFSLQSAC